MPGLESLAYAIARGVARAWFEALAEREAAVREAADSADFLRAARLRDTVHQLRENDGHPQ